MIEYDAFDAYIRFVTWLAVGLTAFSVVAGGVIDQFLTEHSIRDYRRAHELRKWRKVVVDDRELDVVDVSIFDLASQLTSGRLSRKSEQELHKKLSSRSYRSLIDA